MIHTQADVLASTKLREDLYKVLLRAPGIAKEAQPGQFLMVDCPGCPDRILRRPLSIHRRPSRETFELLYRVRGEGTAALSRVPAGSSLDVIGPLGRGFEQTPYLDQALLVAGGLGVAPLLFLAEELVAAGTRLYVLIGARGEEDLCCLEELRALSVKTLVATEDGSVGARGLVTDLIPVLFEEVRVKVYFACGPVPMLKAVARIAGPWRMSGQVALEERMACGVGVCLSCGVKTKQGGARVCADGPVFYVDELDW